MYLKGLYEISAFAAEDGSFSATIAFDAKHDIFKGHFPGQPVVPGVCLIHIVKELANIISAQKVKLIKGSNIKFLQLIDPRNHPEVIIKGRYSGNNEGEYTLSAAILKGETTFFKFNGVFS